MRPLAACLLLFGLSSAAGFGQAPASPHAGSPAANAVRLTKYILGVADLDKSYAFYHALGFELENGKDTLNKPSVLPEPLLKLVDVPAGTKFRNMMLKVPGADFALEVTEFTNLELRPVRPRSQDPGASTFLLTVRDVDAALAIAKKAGGEGERASGPIQMVKDPDGYYVELLKPSNPPAAGAAPANAIVIGAGFGFIVQDAESAGRFYQDHLGFRVDTSAYRSTPNSQIRTSRATVPGTSLTWLFTELKGVDRKPYRPRIPDPGAAAVGLQVRDLDAAEAAVKAAGGSVITQGGSAGLGAGKVGFVRDPSGILVEFTELASRK